MPFTRPSFTEGVRERSEWATDAETGGWGRPRSLYSPSPGAPWAVSSLVHPSLVTIRPVGAPKGRRNRRWRMNEGPRGGSNGGMEMVMIGLCLSAHASRLRPFIKNISIPFSLRLTAFDWYLHPWVPFAVLLRTTAEGGPRRGEWNGRTTGTVGVNDEGSGRKA